MLVATSCDQQHGHREPPIERRLIDHCRDFAEHTPQNLCQTQWIVFEKALPNQRRAALVEPRLGTPYEASSRGLSAL